MQDLQPGDDSMTLRLPRWVSATIAATAEVILIIVTLAIIAAMWLPAYLSNAGSGGVAHDQSARTPHQR